MARPNYGARVGKLLSMLEDTEAVPMRCLPKSLGINARNIVHRLVKQGRVERFEQRNPTDGAMWKYVRLGPQAHSWKHTNNGGGRKGKFKVPGETAETRWRAKVKATRQGARLAALAEELRANGWTCVPPE